MSEHQTLAERKELVLAQLKLERMQVALYAGEIREAVRPAGLIGGAVAKPAAAVAMIEAIAPLFGLQRIARWVRLGSIAFAIIGIARHWRRTNPRSSAGA
jgi:hypothetical protein